MRSEHKMMGEPIKTDSLEHHIWRETKQLNNQKLVNFLSRKLPPHCQWVKSSLHKSH